MLECIYRLDFEIELLTGLHIGGSTDTFDIGGADSTVIKNPLTHEPYIPVAFFIDSKVCKSIIKK